MNIYLDVEGVLMNRGKPARHLKEFLKYLTDHHDVYWLTTLCRGDAKNVVCYLKKFLDEETLSYCRKIKATNWRTWKTEGIDFSQDFRWLDNCLFPKESDDLDDNDAGGKWIEIDLQIKPNILGTIIEELRI